MCIEKIIIKTHEMGENLLKKNKELTTMQSSIGSLLAAIPISANGWTFLSLVFAVCGFGLLAFGSLLLASFIYFLFAFACDAIDGAVARAKHQVSKKGAFIDGVSDRFVEFLLAFGFLFYGIPPYYFSGAAWLILFIFFGTCVTSFVKAYAGHTEAIENSISKKMPGLFERAERVLLILAGMFGAILTGSTSYVTAAFIIASALSFITVLQRIRFTLRS